MNFARLLLLPVFVTGVLACATDYPPQDHGNQNLVLVSGDRIWGEHTHVGLFEIPSGSVVKVAPYDGVSTQTGWVVVKCSNAAIAGTLDASGAGYTGGGGGGGAGGYLSGGSYWHFPPSIFAEGHGGNGAYTKAGCYGGEGIRAGAELIEQWGQKYWVVHPGQGGRGGNGDGPLAGNGGTTLTPNGQSARLAGEGERPAWSPAECMGSGGGGGAGSSFGGVSGGDGGGGGGRGGGAIQIVSSDTLVMGSTAVLITSGTLGGTGSASRFDEQMGGIGGNGANSEPAENGLAGYNAGNGSAGAGGAVFLDVRGANSVTFQPGSTIDTRSGDGVQGGPWVLVHDGPTAPNVSTVLLRGGLLFMYAPPSAVNEWKLY